MKLVLLVMWGWVQAYASVCLQGLRARCAFLAPLARGYARWCAFMRRHRAAQDRAAQLLAGAAMTVFTGASFADDPLGLSKVLCPIADSFRGPVALAIGIVAISALGFSLMWGEEIAGMSRKLINVVVGVSVAFGGPALVGWVAVKFGAASSCMA